MSAAARTRAAILSDVHGNLPALAAALAAIARLRCDAIYHLGDAIGIGPFPAECLDRLREACPGRLVFGNHDAWFAFGLPSPQPPWMSDAQVAHQRWIHAQIDPALRSTVAAWPLQLKRTLGGTTLSFVHYGLRPGGDWAPIVNDPLPDDLDRLFANHQADLILFGHDHAPLDRRGRARYVNPGSLGCSPESVARFVVVDSGADGYKVEHHAVPYDAATLFAAFERRHVPERHFIYRAFFSRGPDGF